MQKVKDGIYVETEFWGANLGCVVTKAGLVLIDSSTLPQDILKWREEIGPLSDKGVAYMINTDHHEDHAFGSGYFTKNIIIHKTGYDELMKSNKIFKNQLVKMWKEMGDKNVAKTLILEVALPRIAFEDKMVINLEDKTFELTRVGGHSAATIMIYIPGDKILFTGDNVQDKHPWQGQANFKEWIDALSLMEEIDVEVVVTGHERLMGSDGINKMRTYFQQMWDSVEKLLRDDASKEEVVERVNMLGYFAVDESRRELEEGWLKEAIHRMYDEVRYYLKK